MSALWMTLMGATLAPAPSPDPGDCSFVTGSRADGTLEARVTCAWAVDPALVSRTVGDFAGHDRVFSVVTEAEALGVDASGRALVRQVHAAPFISDREVVLAVAEEPMPDGVRYRWEKAAEQPAVAEGRVEPRVNAGVWEVRGDGRGGTRLDYAIALDPGGSLPSAVVSWLQGVALEGFFRELEAAVGAE